MSFCEDQTLAVAPLRLSLDEVYEIGLCDGRRGLPRRETFLLPKWGWEQQACYNKGYLDGVREAQYLHRPRLLFPTSKCRGSPDGERRKVTFH